METTGVAELVAAAARGDEGAWSALVDRFAGLVWSVIVGYRLGPADAADVSQTTWLRAAEHIGRLRDPERIGSWLATTAGREALRVIKHNQRQTPTDDLYLLDVPDADPELQPETRLLALEEESALWEAFSELPHRAQILLRLLFADPPPSYEEISAVTGMPIGSIGPTRGRYLAQLRGKATLAALEETAGSR